MQPLAILLVVVHLAAGTLHVLIARPLIRRKIPPNGLYGFRTRRTLGDSRIWYHANAYSGQCLYRAGIATIVAGLALFSVYLVMTMLQAADSPTSQIVYMSAGVLIVIVPALASVIASYRYLARIPT